MKGMDHIFRRWGGWWVLGLGLLVLLPGTGSAPLFDRDEPRFAQATVEMMERGNWIVPYFNEQYRFDKPPLTYWWMGLHYALFGIREWTARLHTVISTVLLGLLLFYAGRRWYGPRAGWTSAVGWLTGLQVLIHGRIAVADMPMVLSVAAAMISAFELLHRPRKESGTRAWFFALYGSLAAGFLAKGPIAWLVPVVALGLYRVFVRKKAPWSRLRFAAGIPLMLAPVAAWGLPALWMTGGAFWKVGMGYHVVQRGMETFNQRTFIPGVYLGTALFSLFPWIAFLPTVIRFVRRNFTSRTAFLCAWFIAPYIVFSFYATQLPHYVLPGFPAFFLLMGPALERVGDVRLDRIVRTVYFLLWMAIAVAVIVIAFGADFSSAYRPASAALLGCGAALIGLMMLAESVRRMEWRRHLTAVLVVGAGFGLIGHGLQPLLPSKQMAGLFKEMPPNTEYASWRFNEPSLVFYSHAPWTVVNTEDEARAFLSRPGPRMLVHLAMEQDLDDCINHRLDQRKDPVIKPYGAETLALLEDRTLTGRMVIGLNFAKSSLVEVEALYRKE